MQTTIDYSSTGADQVALAGRKIESTFKSTESAYNKYSSAVAKSIKGSGGGIGGGIGGGSAIAEVAAFAAVGKLASKVLEKWLTDKATASVNGFLGKQTDAIFKDFKKIGDGVGSLLKQAGIDKVANKALGGLSSRIIQPISKKYSSVKSSILGVAGNVSDSLFKSTTLRKGVLLARKTNKIVRNSIGGFAVVSKKPIVKAFGSIASGVLGLVGRGAAILVGATAAIVAGSALLDRRVQKWFSDVGDWVSKKIITPTTKWLSEFWEAFKTGLQKYTGGLLQTKSIDIDAKEVSRKMAPEEQQRYLNQQRVQLYKQGNDQKYIDETTQRIQQMFDKQTEQYNKQIEDIIEAQKYTRRL